MITMLDVSKSSDSLAKHKKAADSFRLPRILLGQLGANGDCLYATAVARQIKTDYPGCHLTWAIGSGYRSILNGNPFVDEIWEVPATNQEEICHNWEKFEKEAIARRNAGDFDEVFFTQIPPNNFKNFDGTVRSSIFRGYTKPITVSVAPVMRLSPDEIENTRSFAQSHHLSDHKHVILFECASTSGQSFVTPEFAIEVAKKLIESVPDVCIILSSKLSIDSTNTRIIDGSKLPFRENVELTKYCALVVGCSSGISWLCTSDWAKPLPMVQLLAKDKSVYASFIHDYEYRNIPTDSIIEMTDCSVDRVSKCLSAIFKNGFNNAKLIFHEQIPLKFDHYFYCIYNFLVMRDRYKDAFISLKYTIGRYGLHPHLLFFILRILSRYGRYIVWSILKYLWRRGKRLYSSLTINGNCRYLR